MRTSLTVIAIFCFAILTSWISNLSVAIGASSEQTSKKARAVVASYNPQAREAAKKVLEAGGNAFDAFIAATLVEYVVAPGVTSLAGPITALTYHKRSGEVWFLDAEMNHASDLNGMWKEGEPAGKGVMVPGALRGLEAIHKRYGTQTWESLVEPAIELAENGFEISELYQALIQYRKDSLGSTVYGAKTFFRNGKPLVAGDRLFQPELAAFLRGVARGGADAMYEGEWAKKFVQVVRERGGLMTEADLRRYQAHWRTPRSIIYRGYKVYGSAGRSIGGAWSLLALKTIENYEIGKGPHFSVAADPLEVMVRVARTVWSEEWFNNPHNLDNGDAFERFVSPEYAVRLWERVKGQLAKPTPRLRGSHSYHVVIVDGEGNAISGTNTINSLPWGDRVFVDGIPLTNFISHLGLATRPGERRMTPMSSHIVLKDGRLKSVSGNFNSSLIEAGFQILVNVLDYNLPGETAAHLPRFGTFPLNLETKAQDFNKNWLDPSVSKEIVEELRRRGLEFEQGGPNVDTGSGAVVTIGEDGSVEGGLLPLDGHDGTPTYIYR